MNLKAVIITLFVSSCFAINAIGQYDTTLYFDPITDDIAKRIPPIEALMDSAIANTPRALYQELQAAYYYYEMKSAQVAWTEHFGLTSEINYGNWYFNDRDELTRLNKFYLTESRRWNWEAGFYIRFPVHAIVNRQFEIKKQKKQMEMALAERQHQIKETREHVIRTYHELLQQQHRLQISADYQQFSEIAVQMAGIQYRNGEIDMAEYQRLKDYQTRGALEFAKTLGDFNIAYTLLEELVGFKFGLINTLR